jgi:MFS family permease
MLNNLRILSDWQNFFHDPEGSQLGLLTALYNIGSIISLPFVPIMADNFGRRLPIIVGCVLMIVGAAIQGCASNIKSKRDFPRRDHEIYC